MQIGGAPGDPSQGERVSKDPAVHLFWVLGPVLATKVAVESAAAVEGAVRPAVQLFQRSGPRVAAMRSEAADRRMP